MHKIEKSKQDHNGLTTIKMPRVIGLKVHSHYTRILSTLILFLKSSRLKSYVVVGG